MMGCLIGCSLPMGWKVLAQVGLMMWELSVPGMGHLEVDGSGQHPWSSRHNDHVVNKSKNSTRRVSPGLDGIH